MGSSQKGVDKLRAVKGKDNKGWLELCEYVKQEILEYDENMKFPQYLALKLQGLKKGKYIANNNIKSQANYDDRTILYAFKLYKKKIVTYLHNNASRIKDEKHKINLIVKMVEPEINDVYLRLKELEKSNARTKNLSYDNQSNDHADYTKKTKEVSDKMKDLF